MLLAGRPFTGERGSVPGLEYPPEAKDFWTRHLRTIWRYYQAHPQGPTVTDGGTVAPAVRRPGQPGLNGSGATARWSRKAPGPTWKFATATGSALPEKVVASAFAHWKLHLVLANYAASAAVVETRRPFRDPQVPAAPTSSWRVPARTLMILER